MHRENGPDIESSVSVFKQHYPMDVRLNGDMLCVSGLIIS